MTEEIQDGLTACIDYIRATFKHVHDPHDILALLLMKSGDFIEQHGNYGYKSSLRNKNITIYYDGREDMGVHLEMSGQGCREFETHGVWAWNDFLQAIKIVEGKFTRIDLAIDDIQISGSTYETKFKLEQLEKKARTGELISKFKEVKTIEKLKIVDGKSKGKTLYFGSSTSRILIRMYEKHLEQEVKKRDIENIDRWNRVEIEAKDERAEKIVSHILESADPVGKTAQRILKQYINFKTRKKGETNKNRWNDWKPWQLFLGECEGLQLTTKKELKPLHEKAEWLERSVSKTLFAIREAYGSAKIYEILKIGEEKLQSDELLLQQVRDRKTSKQEKSRLLRQSNRL